MSRPLRGRTNLNQLIIMEDIYQITKRYENDACTVQWRVKKIEHSTSIWLVIFDYPYQRKETFSKVSHLGVHIIYTLYIFAKTLWVFLFAFYIFTQPIYIDNINIYTYIYIYIYIFI